MQKSEKYNYDLEKFYIKGSGNILTLLMFPIAFNLTTKSIWQDLMEKINNDDYYWKHSSHNQMKNY